MHMPADGRADSLPPRGSRVLSPPWPLPRESELEMSMQEKQRLARVQLLCQHTQQEYAQRANASRKAVSQRPARWFSRVTGGCAADLWEGTA